MKIIRLTIEHCWGCVVRGADLPAVENLHITYSGHSVSLVTLHLQIPPTMDHGSCSPVLFTIEKNPCVSGSAQFKPMLVKGQLYVQNVLFILNQ